MRQPQIDLQVILSDAVSAIMKQRANVSDQKALECILSAIECGDFMMHVQGYGEYFSYVPYRRQQELLSRIEALEIEAGKL